MTDEQPPAAQPARRPRRRILAALGPGILLAATGVGAGDLATASFAGSKLGVAILWAVVLGAAFKFVLNEGLARYQLGTGRTLLEGATLHFPWAVYVFFIPYFLGWSYWVGSALISACGVTAHALVPIFETPERGKLFFGIAHSLAALGLIWFGGFRIFEKFMSVCIAVMFLTVVVTAGMVADDLPAAMRGLVTPSVPDHELAWQWTIALMGGVGGTLTVLCYGYWLREEGRAPGAKPTDAQPSAEREQAGPAEADVDTLPTSAADYADNLWLCRVDLAAAYLMTGLFGIAMVIIGSTIQVEGKGAGLIVALANRLDTEIGPAARWLFLIGAWGAVFSSLLGVLQAVPYLFADLLGQIQRRWQHDRLTLRTAAPVRVDTRAWPYRLYLVLLALVPLLGLVASFERVQRLYGLVGAWFMPVLALTLFLLLTLLPGAVPKIARNRVLTTIALLATLAFFAWTGWEDFAGAWADFVQGVRGATGL